MQSRYLITGASSDVGTLFIDRILQKEPEATVMAQGLGHLSQLEPLAEKYPQRLSLHAVNLTDAQALKDFLDRVEQNFGVPTHFLHLPALRVINKKFKTFDESRFMLDFEVQVGAALAICKRFVPQMAKKKHGRVLFMLTSYIVGAPPKHTAAYVMAKEALYGLAKSLAADYASAGVTVNCVAPSMIETKFLEDTPDLIIQAAAEANPMGRNAVPEDVVPAMEFLLSEEARFITGVMLPVTGGSTML